MANQVALIKVYEIRSRLSKHRADELAEEFIVRYPEKDYPEPEYFRDALERHLNYYANHHIRVLDLINISVGIQANRVIGNFFASSYAPADVKRARTFIVNLHYR